MKQILTIHSDLAITVAVAGGQEGLGLLVGECPGGGREVLQEEPVEGGGPGWGVSQACKRIFTLAFLTPLQSVLLT